MTTAEELERRILLKRQLMTLTDKEIQVLEDMLRKEKERLECSTEDAFNHELSLKLDCLIHLFDGYRG